MPELCVDPELKKLIPPLTPEEYRQLEENIVAEGCRDALVVWGDVIVDGHNRYEICRRHGIEFKVVPKEFESKDAAKVWIINNQKGRRNLTDGWKWELAQKKKKLLEEKGRENKQTAGQLTGRGKVLSPSDKTFNHDTRKEIASELGWSSGKVAQADYVWKHGDEEIKEKVKRGEETVKGAYSTIKKDQRKRDIAEQRRAIESGSTEMPEGVFEVIVVDPPWDYKEKGGFGVDEHSVHSNRGGVDYATMTTEEIKGIDLPEANDCILFLWTTHKFLSSAFEILEQWGYEYKATIVWDKDVMGIGRTLRLQCEFCLLGVKGSPLLNVGSERDIIREQRREHSRKPERFYEFVERFTVGRKLDYFSRDSRRGWEQYGLEAGKF